MFKTIEEVEKFFKERRIAGIKPGLYRMEQLLKYAGNPEQRTKFIHVAGTNGKGSTIQYMKAGLRAANIDLGVFSSPSLDGLLGHIMINDSKIDEADFIKLLNELFPKIKEMDRRGDQPTEFEIITALAFIYFSKKVPLAIIEAGMGGKGDTTNCIQPLLSVITNVSIDHKDFLGPTLSDIALEKAGIIKEETPLLTGDLSRDNLAIFKQRAKELNSPLIVRNEDFFVENEKMDKEFILFDLIYKSKVYKLKIKAKGTYQVFNSSLAAIALIELSKDNLFSNSPEEIIQSFSEVSLAGRFETISHKPKVIVDGAHNVAAVRSLVDTIKTQFKNENKTLIFSAFSDKEVEEMLSILIPHFDQVILTTFNHPRACSIEELKSITDFDEAKLKALDLVDIVKIIKVNPAKTSYIFTGSLHFVKNVKKLFHSLGKYSIMDI